MSSNFFNLNSLKSILLIIPVLLLCSCGKRTISVSSRTLADSQLIPNGFSYGSSFCILPAEKQNQLFSKEVIRKITQLIKKDGYLIEDAQNADYYLVFSTDVTSHTGTTNVPLYLPGQTQSTNGYINGYRGSIQYQEQTRSSGSFIFVPSQYTFFYASLLINIYDGKIFRKSKKEEYVWQGSASHCGDDCDLTKIIDYLLVAVFKFFGFSTQGNVQSYIDYDCNEIRELKSDYVPPVTLTSQK